MYEFFEELRKRGFHYFFIMNFEITYSCWYLNVKKKNYNYFVLLRKKYTKS